MSKEQVIYNGVSMVPEWPAKIEENQKILHFTIDGEELPRVRYGEEDDDWGADSAPCHDCGVIKGQIHVFGCDVERCPKCGGQVISCDCNYDGDDEE